MRRQGAWGIAILLIVVSLSNWASAFHHLGCGCYAPAGNPSAVYSGCMFGYPACGPVGYGPCVGYPGCGGGNCHRCLYVCHPCCLAAKIHYHCLAKQARHYARCASRHAPCGNTPCGCVPYDYAANGGAPGGSVTGDSVTGNSSGAIDLPPGAKIISDRVLGEGETPTPTPDQSSAVAQRSPFRLAGLEQNSEGGLHAFERGLAAFRNGSMNDALRAFTTAADAEPSSAIYHYYRALAMFEVAGADAAQEILATAVEVEQREGVENWGQRMERVQGRGRLWIEKARRDANLVR